MKKKEIIGLLLTRYLMAFELIGACENIYNANNILLSFRVDMGVCKCAETKLGVKIHHKRWVKRHIPYQCLFWYPPPCIGGTIERMQERLRVRIDILREELKRPWWKF